MTSKLDYCALLCGCSARLINKLQMVQNAAARVITSTRKYDHISPVLSTLHWLPIKHRIDFKILLITYKALSGLAPQYLSELLSQYSPPRPLRSQNSGHLIIHQQYQKLHRKKIDIYANISLFLSCSEVTVATRSSPYPAQTITAVTKSSPYPDQMVDQHLEMTSTALNVSGDQDT